MAGKTRVSEIFYMQASLFMFLVQKSMSEGVFLQGCKRELNVLTALERTGVLCYTTERLQWHTLPRVLGAIFILVQSGDFSYSREQQAEDAAGLTLRAVYLLCVYWCCELSYSNGLFFQNWIYVLRNLGCRDKDLWSILSVETRPLFLLHFCILNEIRPAWDAMATDTSIGPNKPFVRGVLQMFFSVSVRFLFS